MSLIDKIDSKSDEPKIELFKILDVDRNLGYKIKKKIIENKSYFVVNINNMEYKK